MVPITLSAKSCQAEKVGCRLTAAEYSPRVGQYEVSH